MEIHRLNETSSLGYDNFCIYGISGVGKTYFAGSYGDRTAILSIGAGLRTLHSPTYRKLNYNPIIIEINEAAVSAKGEAGDLFDMITDGIDMLLEKHLDDFDVIIIDDQSALSRAARIKGMQMSSSRTLANAKMNESFPLGELNDWGPEQSLLTWFFDTYTKTFKSLKKYFLITAHERVIFKKRDSKDIGNPEPAVHKYQPDAVGKDAWVPGTYMGFFDNVWRMTMESGIKLKGEDVWRNRVTTRPNSIIAAKTRLGGVFHNELINPTLSDVIKYTQESSQHPYNKPLYKGTV